MDLRYATLATVTFGPFVSSTDGKTPVTGITVPTARTIYGGTSSSYTPGSWTEIGDGYYSGTITPGTAGKLRVTFAETGSYLSCWHDYNVMQAAAYDMVYAAIGSGGMAAVNPDGDLPTTAETVEVTVQANEVVVIPT